MFQKHGSHFRYDAARPVPGAPVRQVGLFVYGDKAGDVDVGALPEPDLGNSMGFNVISWRDGDVVYQLVSDPTEDDIRALLPDRPRGPSQPVAPPRPALDVRPASLRQ